MSGTGRRTRTSSPLAGSARGRDLAADAGGEPALRESYRLCAKVARRHGKTYAMAARLLPPDARRHVHAVYAFCRVADDIVDDLGERPTPEREEALQAFGARFRSDLVAGRSEHPVLAAVVATVKAAEIDPECFDRFLASMSMDFDRVSYQTWADLCGYMDGSAAVIGEMMLPVLRPTDQAAFEPARQLGIAFQLTNFLRDIGEDLERGRVYVPQQDIARFGADPWRREVTPAWRALMRFEIERTRQIYATADPGIAMLPPRSARCVSAARVLYSRILDRIEAADYDVFTSRVGVSQLEKASTAAQIVLGRTPRGAPTA